MDKPKKPKLTEAEKELARALYEKLKNIDGYHKNFEHCIALLDYEYDKMKQLEEYVDDNDDLNTDDIFEFMHTEILKNKYKADD